MNKKNRIIRLCSFFIAFFMLYPHTKAQTINEPLGGKPPAGVKSSIKDYNDQLKYMRAFEVAVWAMPAVSIYGFRRATLAIGGKDNTILAWSKVAGPNAELLTANDNTPYILAMSDLQKGPVVLEVPPATKKTVLYGQVVDMWQFAIADVGPVGADKGKGGKYLFLPPGYKGPVPEGYIVKKSPSYRIYLAFRSIRKPGSGATLQDAYNYSKRLKMYYLNHPEPTRYIDPSDKRFATLPHYDESMFRDIHDIFTVEPVKPQDKIMMGYLSYLGIEKGKPYHPDETTKKAMRQAAADFYYYMQHRLTYQKKSMYYWPNRHWQDVLTPDKNGYFSFVYKNSIDVDARAERYFFATYYPRAYYKHPANIYMFTKMDKYGHPLEAGKLYKLTIPAHMPVKQFWSLIIYDGATWAFIYTKEKKVGISSYDMSRLKKNPDGSVTLYFGPKAPKGLESNWIPTGGKVPVPGLRFYGAKESIINRTFVMPDVEPVK
ncbi:DUF1254 domain-containing protein [Candidatus Sulfidibacterium hydrothermale]|uniref:DUF1254 domain-containing protein n=1 Tax=Candidatus Sulfidibacterium hydrothermale TaxID=2875962 RepID=UPI001F0B4E97|nr:DUF1254 domain-containing protein [Candidatus Sulfidibacterium hydrothermale]UBM62383.1 DUF1254 domain-containing protein [Candidatus Sulfidibacterium hydrothermale]